MTGKAKHEEAGDAAEVQKLLDGMPLGPNRAPRLEVVPHHCGGGDSEELQALFDLVAERFGRRSSIESAISDENPAPSADAISGAISPDAPTGAPGPEDPLFVRVGRLTRQLHDALSEFGYDRLLQDTARVIPDARQRLSYVARMTEQAASRVLNAVDVARPVQERLQRESTALRGRWNDALSGTVSIEEFQTLARETHAFLEAVPAMSEAIRAQLIEIVMAQDFQDLTGQVIKKLVDTTQNLESDLLGLLVEFGPADRHPEAGSTNGPAVDPIRRNDVVNGQQQVDDLLDSLGF